MFGRKKKKADLDWQPDAATTKALSGAEAQEGLPPHADEAHLHSEEFASPAYQEEDRFAAHRHPAQDHHVNQPHSGQHSGQNDVWTGLVHPRAILRFLGSNFKTIATVTLTVMLLGYAVYLILPDKYGTTALILVDPRQPRVTNSDTVISGIGGDAAALTSYVEIMNSDGFLGKVVDELGIKDDPDFAKAENKSELIAMFRSNLSANRQGATYIVQVYYRSKDPANAAKYANGVAAAFVRDQRDYRVSTNEEATQWLSERLKLLRSNLKTSEDAVAAFQARNGIVDTGAQGTLDNQQLTSLVSRLAIASTEYVEARTRYEQASKDGVPASADSSQSGQFTVLDQLLQEQARLRRQAAELGQSLGSRHPRMQAITEQQRIIAGQISQERSRLVKQTKQAFETAEAKKIAIEQQLADARQRSIQLNKSMVELATLEREATANRNLYEQFLARYKITDEQSRFQFSEARIVSEAPVPSKSTKPSIKLVLPVLMILGLGFSLLYALIREAFSAPDPSRGSNRGRAPHRQPPLYPEERQEAPITAPAPVAAAAALNAEAYEPANEIDNLPEISPAEAPTAPSMDDDRMEPADEPVMDDDALEVASQTGPDADQEPEEETDPEPMLGAVSDDDLATEQRGVTPAEPANQDGEDVARIPDPVIPFRSVLASKQFEGNVPPATKARLGEPLTLVSSIDAPRRSKPVATKGPILITLPSYHADHEDGILDDLLETHGDAIEQFIAKDLEQETVSILVTAAQAGEGETLTADVLREFAIDAGFHPVIISLRDRADKAHKAARSGNGAKTPERVARLQVYEDFDIIPFITAKGISSEQGLAPPLADELRDLIALCRENYGFVILETRHIVDPETLEDLINLVDTAFMVLKDDDLSEEDLNDWQHWAGDAEVGLVLDQTQI